MDKTEALVRTSFTAVINGKSVSLVCPDAYTAETVSQRLFLFARSHGWEFSRQSHPGCLKMFSVTGTSICCTFPINPNPFE